MDCSGLNGVRVCCLGIVFSGCLRNLELKFFRLSLVKVSG